MATTTWNSSGDSDWGTAGNWDTAAVPGTGDSVVFDGTSVINCNLDQSRACASLTVAAGYTGKLDIADSAYTLTLDDGGDCTLAGGGEVDFGTGTVSLTNGNFDNADQGTFTRGTSTLSMAGTADIVTVYGNNLYNLTIASSAIISCATYVNCYGLVTINGTYSASSYLRLVTTSSLAMGDGGHLTGAGVLLISSPGVGEGIVTKHVNSVTDIKTCYVENPAATAVIEEGTYAFNAMIIQGKAAAAYTLTLDGTYTFTGDFELENTNAAGSLTLANNTNDPDITFQGDVIVDEQAGTINWNKGLGTNTFSGASDQDIDFNGLEVEDIVIDKSAGNIVLTGDVTADSFTGTDTGTGDFDINGKTLTTTGNCSLASGFDIDSAADAMNGCTLDIGGDFTANGQTLNATATWDLQVDGSATALGTGVVAYSDASGYASVAAWSGPWTNNGNNLNWEFSILTTATGTITLTREISTISLTPTPRDIDLSLARRTLTLE